MSDDVIKSFLVGLGWKIDKQGEKDVLNAVAGISKAAGAMALALGAAAVAAAAAVTKIAAGFDTLYFSSQRTGASVQNIKALQYAFNQVGSSGEAAAGAIEAYAKAIRTNPGVGQYVKDLGVKQTGDAFNDLSAAIDKIQAKNPYYAGAQMAGLLGISEEQYQTFTKYRKEIATYRAEHEKFTKQFRLNNEEAAKSSASFMRGLTSLGTIATVVGQKFLVALAPAFDRVVKGILSWIDANPEKIERIFNAIAAAGEWVAKAFDTVWKAGAQLFEFLGAKAEELNADGSFLRMWEKIVTVFERVANAIKSVLTWVRELDRATDMSNGLRQIGRILGWIEGKTSGFVEGGAAAAGALDRATQTSVGVPEAQARPGGVFARARRAVASRLGFGDGTQARSPEASGKFRPVYKLTDADLDQKVINTIAGEVSTRNPEGVDAVINNMLNRVGAKGWGPSGNLLQVARAPGQYAGYRAANAKETEFVRERIRAIASGGVPDNTGGSNSYRAAWYNGPWGRKHAADGRVIGGNRFAFENGFPNGPYAPYKEPRAGEPMPAPNYTAPKSFNPGSFDVNRLGGAPMGSGSSSNDNSRSVTQNNPINVTINGASDPATTATAAERAVGRANDLSLRNAQSAIR